MCCVISSLFFLGPRAGLLIWWLVDPGRFSTVYNNLMLPLIGAIFLPVTTLTLSLSPSKIPHSVTQISHFRTRAC
jgi:hypothetical protein